MIVAKKISQLEAQSVKQEFFDRVQKTSDCWLMKTSPSQRYAQISVPLISSRRKMVLAHRVSWVLHYGEIPFGKEVMHICDVTSCINPEHLCLGTHRENMLDCRDKGRLLGRSVRTACKYGHIYRTGSFKINSNGWRACLICRKIYLKKNLEVRRLRQRQRYYLNLEESRRKQREYLRRKRRNKASS